MDEIHVYLENGFEHDRVVVSAGDGEHTEPDVSTQYQVGLAAVVELQAPTSPAVVRIALPERGLAAETSVDPASAAHVMVSITDGALDVQVQAEPPMFA